MEIDLEKLEEKLDKGEELTPEEEKALMEADAPVKEEESAAPDEKDPESKKEESEEEEDDADEETEEQDTGKKAKADKEEAATEDTPSEKDADEAEAKQKEAERKKLVEAEAEKSLDEADIAQFSEKERALFFELRKERRKRQEAQRENDVYKFREAKRTVKREEREQEAIEEDPFKDMDDEDIPTVGQLKKLLKPQPAKKETEEVIEDVPDTETVKLRMENWELKGRLKYPDLPEVNKHVDELLDGDRDAEAEVADVIRKGGNPAIAVYNLIKAHPKWPEIEAKLNGGKKAETKEKTSKEKKSEEEARINRERAERIKKNEKKTQTTGPAGGSAPSGEYTLEEIDAMSEEEFAELPKSKRDAILQRIG